MPSRMQPIGRIPRALLRRFKAGLERRITNGPAKKFWKKHPHLSSQAAQDMVKGHIGHHRPFCAARLGAVELKIMLWGRRIPQIGKFGFNLPIFYSDTHSGAINAGIRPRSRRSYRHFADLFHESMKEIDLMSSWQTSLEHAALDAVGIYPYFCDGEILCPTLGNGDNWAHALNGKSVLVMSPFKDSIERQISRLDRIWPHCAQKLNAQFQVEKFPYLIDENCSLSWEDVCGEMMTIVKSRNYDVALFGCGGLGMPLAAAAKTVGRIGIHLGGHLQLLFGIYGQRHMDHEWHAQWINDSWMRPYREETPTSAKMVEGGCYW